MNYQRKLERMILDLEDLIDERYIDDKSKKEMESALRILKGIWISSTEV